MNECYVYYIKLSHLLIKEKIGTDDNDNNKQTSKQTIEI